METNFKMDIERNHNGDTVRFHGNIDAQTIKHFEGLYPQIKANSVVMDFSNTARINSMGVALLLRTIRSIKNDKKAEVMIQGVNHIHTILFKMSGIFTLAPLVGSNNS